MTDPAAEPCVEGAAFTPLVKGGAALLMAALLAYGVRAAQATGAREVSSSLLLFMALLAAIAGYCTWWIWISRITVTPTRIRQTWWSDKQVAVADITQTRLVLVPGLTWLIAPRLVVRTRGPVSVVFHAAEPPVIAALARLSLGLPPLGDELPPP